MNTDQAQKIYRRWVAALNAARIPESCRHVTQEELASYISGTLSKSTVNTIFKDVSIWAKKGYNFVIDGDKTIMPHSAADIRRRVGNAILQNGITHACQCSDYCPPYGLYVDYKPLIAILMNKAKSAAFVDKMCDQEFLFISEIYLTDNPNQVMRDMVSFKVDEVLRRRRDNNLTTVLSFSNFCETLRGNENYGEEIKNIIDQCGDHGTSKIENVNIIRISTSLKSELGG